jgi:hypothetical protein
MSANIIHAPITSNAGKADGAGFDIGVPLFNMDIPEQ